MKKIKWPGVRRMFLELLGGLAFGAVFFGFLFALASFYSDGCKVTYKGEEDTHLEENNKEESVLIVTDGVEPDQQNIVERPKRVSLGEFKLTAYCSCRKCCGFWAYSRPLDENGNDIVIGASGERLIQGVSIAVDPSFIPYDSKVYIDGKEYIAHDCGGAIKGNRIDVYFDNHQDALDFGVRYANVELLKEEN